MSTGSEDCECNIGSGLQVTYIIGFGNEPVLVPADQQNVVYVPANGQSIEYVPAPVGPPPPSLAGM